MFKGLKGSATKIHMSLSLSHLTSVNCVLDSGVSSETVAVPLKLAESVLFLCDTGYEDQKLFHAKDEKTPTACTKYYGNAK